MLPGVRGVYGSVTRKPASFCSGWRWCYSRSVWSATQISNEEPKKLQSGNRCDDCRFV